MSQPIATPDEAEWDRFFGEVLMRASVLRKMAIVPTFACLPLLAATWMSCGGEDTDSSPVDAGVEDAGGDTDADTGADADADADPGPNELPCDVRAVIEHHCGSCHSSPPTSTATLTLVSRFDFLQPSSVPGETVGARSVARMKSAAAPMPPKSEPPLAAAQAAVISEWVEAGMPPGDCGAIPAKPAETTCEGGSMWGDGDMGSKLMNPGLACRKCHLLQAPEHAYYFGGTVYPSFHEADLCNSPPPPDARIEILDENDDVTMTLLPNEAGNFISSAVAAGVPLPYRARLVANGLTRSMTKPQQDGDCNGCHTEQGAEDAPGRLAWPRPYK
jgi:hypothetical protein